MIRNNKRKNNEKRQVKITPDFLENAHGSVLIESGKTRVICTAMLTKGVPPFLEGKGIGWLTAEYAMLPASTQTRKRRETLKPDGRSTEIKRLIGRCLRSVLDFSVLGENTIYIDCDVISADGGTRTASITGGFCALALCVKKMIKDGDISKNPIMDNVAAISCGIVKDTPLLDLEYVEDSAAQADMNVVMTKNGGLIEVQCTGEKRPVTEEEFLSLLGLAKKGISELFEDQDKVL
jgi:ribonuclease PH